MSTEVIESAEPAGLQNYYEGGATGSAAMLLQGDSLDRLMRLAKVMASGVATIPRHLQKNEADCLAVAMQAVQWGMNPFAVGQKTHTVNGTLGYEAQLVNAVIISRAPVKDRLHFEWFGAWEKIVGKFREVESKTKKDDNGYPVKYRVPAWELKDEDGLGVRVWATFKGEDEPRELTILMTQARTRNSTLWADDPKQQIAYLATKRWARLYCPDVILGVYTPDELDEGTAAMERDITPPATRQTPAQAAEAARATTGAAAATTDAQQAERASLIQKLELETKRGIEAYAKAWAALQPQQRKLVGTDEHARLKGLAEKVIDAEAPAPASQKGPTFTDAVLAVQQGDYDAARDIARSLTDAESAQIESAIANAEGGA